MSGLPLPRRELLLPDGREVGVIFRPVSLTEILETQPGVDRFAPWGASLGTHLTPEGRMTGTVVPLWLTIEWCGPDQDTLPTHATVTGNGLAVPHHSIDRGSYHDDTLDETRRAGAMHPDVANQDGILVLVPGSADFVRSLTISFDDPALSH